MLWQKIDEKKLETSKKTIHSCIHGTCDGMKELFQVLTISLLSLLLPLSFLVLARLSTAQYLLSLNPEAYSTSSSSFLFSFFFNINPSLLYPLVSSVSLAALYHSLTASRITFLIRSSWALLCALQLCVGFGIEASIAAGIEGSGFGRKRSFQGRIVFFLGLHETMLLWSRTVVKPVVDDTIFGSAREERWAERVALAATYGTLWWLRLRDEVESLAIVAEMKKEVSKDGLTISLADFVGWWLYYLTVTIGMVRVVKGLIRLGMILLCRHRRRILTAVDDDDDDQNSAVPPRASDEKV